MNVDRREAIRNGIRLLLAGTTGLSIANYIEERRSMMLMQDSLLVRLNEMVNASIKPMPAAGKGATASINGNDAIGQINFTTGENPEIGSMFHVTFVKPYKVQPFFFPNPEDAPPMHDYWTTVDWFGFDVIVNSVPKPKTNYPWNYLIVARPWSMYINASGAPVDENGKPAGY